jgi:rhamnogalacturonyl hydrolase YesR
MLGHIEAIQSQQAYPDGYPNATANAAVATIFTQHASAAKASQAPDGRWHQLLNDSSPGSFLETSTTAMFVSAIARGIRFGALEKSK